MNNTTNLNEWIEVEGGPCYNRAFKFCYYKGKTNNKYGLKNLWYICCVGGSHHTSILGRGLGTIHYISDGGIEHYYSKTTNVTNTDFKRMFKIIDFNEELHTLSDVEKKYPDGIIK